METLFTEQECQMWREVPRVEKCCKKPDVIEYLKQDRAIDEMPNLYRQCKNCLRIIKNQNA